MVHGVTVDVLLGRCTVPELLFGPLQQRSAIPCVVFATDASHAAVQPSSSRKLAVGTVEGGATGWTDGMGVKARTNSFN